MGDEEGGKMKRRRMGRKRREKKIMPKEGEGSKKHPSILFFNPTLKSLPAPPHAINVFTRVPDREKMNYQAPLLTDQGNEWHSRALKETDTMLPI